LHPTPEIRAHPSRTQEFGRCCGHRSGLLPAPELQLHQRLLLLHLPCSACRLPPLSICCSCYATDASKQLSDTQLPARTGGLRMYSSNCQWLGL
jgi:hypothetical protein